jgi:sugar O-acyltransferase (sialic acid O-acetyltransferase NeuD family)
MEEIVLIGFGGHAKSVIDTILSKNEYHISGYIEREESENLSEYRGCHRIGTDKDLKKIYQQGIKNAVITIGFMGNSMIRNRLYQQMKEIGYCFPVIVDDSAIVAADVVIGEGTYIGKRAVVNAAASIGRVCIVNTAAVIEHESVVGDFSHIAVNAVLCGQCQIGENTLIGANATILQQRKVGDFSIVGAGCTIKRNLQNRCICKHNDDILKKIVLE